MTYPAPEGTELIRRIGAGTLFDVALVRLEKKAVVCKRLRSRMLHEPSAQAAMMREVGALGLLRHPSVPRLLSNGRDGAGAFVLESAMEGVSLRTLGDAWKARGKPVPARLCAHIARASIEALMELHELCDEEGAIGFSHGDLGPDHVLLGPLGDIRFVDFGAARFRNMDAALDTPDRGTLPYAAPEVARGEQVPNAGSDVYALAATLMHLLSGEPLCHARGDAAMLAEIGSSGLRTQTLAQSQALSKDERDALISALALDPALRPKNARALFQAFEGPLTPP